MPAYTLGVCIFGWGVASAAIGFREGFWRYWDIIFNTIVGIWLGYIGYSFHWMQIQDTGRSLRVQFGPGGWGQCVQHCGSSEVLYSDITSVELGKSDCEDGAGPNANKKCERVFLQACCVHTVNVQSKQRGPCCFSGMRKYGASSEQEARELKTWIEQKAGVT